MSVGFLGLLIWVLLVSWHRHQMGTSSLRTVAKATPWLFLCQPVAQLLAMAADHPKTIDRVMNVGWGLALLGWILLIAALIGGPLTRSRGE